MEKATGKVRFMTTPDEYIAMRKAWGNILSFKQEWQGEYVYGCTSVWAEVSGIRGEIRSMFQAVRVKNENNYTS